MEIFYISYDSFYEHFSKIEIGIFLSLETL